MQYQGGKSRIARDIAAIISAGGVARMRYQGGKSRIASDLAPIISRSIDGRNRAFVSLFCGSCAVESKVRGFSRIILNDKHEYLIALLRGVQAGYNLPESINENQYRYVRENKTLILCLPALSGLDAALAASGLEGMPGTRAERITLCRANGHC